MDVREPLLNGDAVSDTDPLIGQPSRLLEAPYNAVGNDESGNALHPIVRQSLSSIPPLTGSLSFFDSYDVIGGALVKIVDIPSRLVQYTLSNSGHWIAGFGRSAGSVQIFSTRGQNSVEHIQVGDTVIEQCRFRADSDRIIQCIDTKGVLTVWEQDKRGQGWFKSAEKQFPGVVKGGYSRFEISICGLYLVSVSSKACSSKAGQSKESSFLVSVVCYNISDVSAPVTEIGRVDVKMEASGHPHVRLSPNGRGVLIRSSGESIVVQDFLQSELRWRVRGKAGKWYGNGVIVTYDREENVSHVWDVSASSLGVDRCVISELDGALELQPVWEVVGEVVDVCGNMALIVDKGHRQIETLWDMRSKSVIGRLDGKERADGHSQPIANRLSRISECGQWIATCVDGTMTVWDVPTCAPVLETQVPNERLGNRWQSRYLSFSLDGTKLVLATMWAQKSRFLVYDLDMFQDGLEVYKDINGEDIARLWAISSDGGKIGWVWRKRGSNVNFVRIWNTNSGNNLKLKRKETKFVTFCFSLNGERVATTSKDGAIALWSVERQSGTTDRCEVICNIRMAFEEKLSHFYVRGMCFLEGDQGKEMLSILTSHQRFIWVDLEGNVVDMVKIQDRQSATQHRFSQDGTICLVGTHNRKSGTLEMQIWGMVQRQMLQKVHFNLPCKDLGGDDWVGFNQQVSVDGQMLAVGVDENQEPWLHKPNDMAKKGSVLLSNNCKVSDHGRSSIVGPIAALSEDGMHVATCVKMSDSTLSIRVQAIGNDMQGRIEPQKEIRVHNAGKVNGTLLMSGNGQRIAWITSGRIGVWGPLCDMRCIPSYERLKLSNLTENKDALSKLLKKHGRNLLNYPDFNGWSLFARAIEDRNTEWVRVMLEWAMDNHETISLSMMGHRNRADLANLLQLALDMRYPECVQLLVKGTLNGTLVAHNWEALLCEMLQRLIDVYPTIFNDVVCDENILQHKGTIMVPHSTFQVKPFVVASNNEIDPINIEGMWSKPLEPLVQGVVGGMKKFLASWKKSGPFDDNNLKIPAESYVIPVDGLAQVGSKGWLGKLMSKDIKARAFTSLPLKCMIEYKWEAVGRALVFNDMCAFAFLLLVFTIYSILLGYGCREDDSFHAGYEIPCAAFLVMSMILSILGVHGEIKQMVNYHRERRRWSYYWLRSKWNALEFATYVLIVFVVPAFHFQNHPCISSWGISWTVPTVSILLWWKTLYYAQAFRRTGPLVLMIFAIMTDIFFFLIIGSGVLIGFGVAFFVLYRGDETNRDAFGTLDKSLLSTFGMMLGEFDLDVFYSNRAPVMAIFLFVAYVLIMSIILLNLLIALMQDSYECIKEAEEEQFVMARAMVIDDMESMLPKSQQAKLRERIGRFVHVLLPRDRVEDAGEWHGRMIELENRFRKVVTESREALNAFVKERTEALDKKISVVEEQLTHVANTMGASISKCSMHITRLETSMETQSENARSNASSSHAEVEDSLEGPVVNAEEFCSE